MSLNKFYTWRFIDIQLAEDPSEDSRCTRCVDLLSVREDKVDNYILPRNKVLVNDASKYKVVDNE